MSNDKVAMDCRKHNRFRVKDEVLFVYGDDSIGIGSPLDISSGGLAFRYSSTGRETADLSSIYVYLMGDPPVYIMEMPCITVYDHSVEPVVHGLTFRRCGVRFVGLSQSELAKLDAFLRQYTTIGD